MPLRGNRGGRRKPLPFRARHPATTVERRAAHQQSIQRLLSLAELGESIAYVALRSNTPSPGTSASMASGIDFRMRDRLRLERAPGFPGLMVAPQGSNWEPSIGSVILEPRTSLRALSKRAIRSKRKGILLRRESQSNQIEKGPSQCWKAPFAFLHMRYYTLNKGRCS